MSELRQRKMSNCVYRIGVGRSRLGAAAAMGTAVLSLLAFTSACTEQAACPPGSEWEDPNDPDNLSCIDKTNDDGGSGGLGGGVNAGGSVNAGGVNAGAANAGAANAGGANAGGNTMSAGGSGASDTGTGGTIDLGRCGGTADQSQDAYDGWDFTDLRPLAQSFTASAATLSEVSIYVHTTGQLDTFTVSVVGDDGGNPDLANVLGSADVQNSVAGTENDAEWLCADIADITVNAGEQYWILLDEGNSPVRKNWHHSNEGQDPYPGGTKKVTNNGGDSWIPYPGEDYAFRTYP